MNVQIEREFARWGCTCAERSVAHLTLKGLRLKDIARARNTSDRTVRQQDAGNLPQGGARRPHGSVCLFSRERAGRVRPRPEEAGLSVERAQTACDATQLPSATEG